MSTIGACPVFMAGTEYMIGHLHSMTMHRRHDNVTSQHKITLQTQFFSLQKLEVGKTWKQGSTKPHFLCFLSSLLPQEDS